MGTKWKDCSATDRAMVLLTGTLAVFTLILLVFTKKQVSDIEGSSKKQLRAYISVLTPRLGKDSIRSNPLKVAFIMKNSGHTPAYDVRDFTQLRIVSTKEADNMPDPHYFKVGEYHQVVGPNVETLVWKQTDGEPRSHLGLSPTEYRVFLYGKIEYEDIFGANHWTTFCYQYQWWIEGGQFYLYALYNDADKNE
jgi:hypothetical protein